MAATALTEAVKTRLAGRAPNWSHDSRYLYVMVSIGGNVCELSIPGGQPEFVVSAAGVDTAYAACLERLVWTYAGRPHPRWWIFWPRSGLLSPRRFYTPHQQA